MPRSATITRLPPSEDPLSGFSDASVHCVVTTVALDCCVSDDPPLHGERIADLVGVLQEVKRTLRHDGTMWLRCCNTHLNPSLMLPARLMMALQGDGWWLRSEIIWVTDQSLVIQDNAPGRSYEKVFLLSKRPSYFYDAEAIRIRNAPLAAQHAHSLTADFMQGHDPAAGAAEQSDRARGHIRRHDGLSDRWDKMTKAEQQASGANLRDVWEAPSSTTEAPHMPAQMIETCVLTGSSTHGVCAACGEPWHRILSGRELDLGRPQTRRAIAIAEESGLTDAHLDAIRAVGVSDTGKNKLTQTGSGRNDAAAESLAREAKEALGGYYREFLLGIPVTAGWAPNCECGADHVPATVLDPFAVTETVGLIAADLGRSSVLAGMQTPMH